MHSTAGHAARIRCDCCLHAQSSLWWPTAMPAVAEAWHTLKITEDLILCVHVSTRSHPAASLQKLQVHLKGCASLSWFCRETEDKYLNEISIYVQQSAH